MKRLWTAMLGLLAAAATASQAHASIIYEVFNPSANFDGTGTIVATTTVNGVVAAKDAQSDLSYTVNKDCSGSFTVLSVNAIAEIFVAPDGEEMVVIQTNTGQSDAHSSQRVGPE